MDHHINPSTMEIKCGSNSDNNCYQPPPLNKSYSMFLNTKKEKRKKKKKKKKKKKTTTTTTTTHFLSLKSHTDCCKCMKLHKWMLLHL